MKKDLIYALIQDPNLIPGIYTYCDGWCEKCDFTKNCLNFKMIEEGVLELKKTEPAANSAMANLDEMFQLSMQLLQHAAKNLGLELPKKTLVFNEAEEAKKDELILDSEIMLQAGKYSELVDNWFAEFGSFSYVGNITLEEFINCEDRRETTVNAPKLFKASEAIRWYQVTVPLKLFRSLKSKTNSRGTPNGFYWYDTIASAKVALISIDKSIKAWSFYLQTFPTAEDQTLNILLVLSKLRTSVEKTFPDARDFIRPGFDI